MELTPAAKLVWIRMRFDELRSDKWPHRARLLVKRLCLARSTVYEALRQGLATGWLVRDVDPVTGKQRWRTAVPVRNKEEDETADDAEPEASTTIPVDLIRAAHVLRPQAILCYGLLKALNRRLKGSFKWAQLQKLAGLDLRTIKRAVRALVDARWMWIAQKNRRAPIYFGLRNADEAYKEEIARYLEKAGFVGEALMRSYLSLVSNTDECHDGARPEFLVNPASGERMELDRYYPLHRVAFEFNGKQHYVPTERFNKQQVAAQKKRDQLKQRICEGKGIKLIVVHPEDLSLVGILRKVGTLLPRKALRGFKETIRYLNFCAYRYRLRSQRPVKSAS